MAKSTREQFLDTAEALFAERGFYGVSIASVADELGLTKQALLHHFGSKEKLYGAVLQRISDYVEGHMTAVSSAEPDPAHRLKSYMLSLLADTLRTPERSQLLMRELLDNRRRADTAGVWYLQSYLNALTEMVGQVPGWEEAPEADRFSIVYQLLGAVNYFSVSQPTLRGIFGAARARDVHGAFPGRLGDIIDAALTPRPGCS